MTKGSSLQVVVTKDRDPRCPTCGSRRCGKQGLRWSERTPLEATQQYRCKRCGSMFRAGREDKPFRFQFSQEIIDYAMDCIRSGQSYRETVDDIQKRFDRRVSSPTIMSWNRRFLGKKFPRDKNARMKVINVVLKNISRDETIRSISELAGTNYNSTKVILRRLKLEKNKPQTKVNPNVTRLRTRVTYLERRIREMQGQLASAKMRMKPKTPRGGAN